MVIVLVLVGLFAGFLSGSVGFGGGMVLLPVLTYFYGIEVAVPVSTIAQLMSNLSRVGIGWKSIKWTFVWQFLILAVPFTALGAVGFAVVPKQPMTVVLGCALIVFAILKLRGKMNLPHKPATMIVGGGITGLINGLLGISGPLSSACYFTLNLAAVSYISTEATSAVVMHIVKIIVYGKLNLMTTHTFLNGLYIGLSMMVGNFVAMKLIGKIENKIYKKIVAVVMILVSAWLVVSNI